jgi:hypothetical protein
MWRKKLLSSTSRIFFLRALDCFSVRWNQSAQAVA